MNARFAFVIVGCLVLLVVGQIATGDVTYRYISTGQQQAAQAPAVAGHYQMAVVLIGPNSLTYVCDTTTGECWYTQGTHEKIWTSLGSPADKAKAAK